MNQNPIDGQLTIIDAEGNEKLCQILFTLESEEFGKKYVVFYELSELSDSDDDGAGEGGTFPDEGTNAFGGDDDSDE